jgi:hypothetical protein
MYSPNSYTLVIITISSHSVDITFVHEAKSLNIIRFIQMMQHCINDRIIGGTTKTNLCREMGLYREIGNDMQV